MGKRITIIQGHPDPEGNHFCHALAAAYAEAALAAGHEVRTIPVSRLDFPLIRNAKQFTEEDPPAAIRRAQEDIRWAEHLVICYPLWLGTLPALLKAFFEQTFRYGFALGMGGGGRYPRKLLKGRSARIFVTMGMPAAVYRYVFGAHGLKSLEGAVLGLSGIRPIRSTLVGAVEAPKPRARQRALAEARELGAVAR